MNKRHLKKIQTGAKWEDLNLPKKKVTQLKDICKKLKPHYPVLTGQKFAQESSPGGKFRILFTGPPGTSKTMAARVIASELELDLFKIDLSGVVSKYVGETEKNLDRVLARAEKSEIILLFDETDDLFGRRSEVKDTHDRFENMDTGYLLQRIEDHEGVIILSTNLPQDKKKTLVRRFHFIVEFPSSKEEGRDNIW